MTKLEEALKKVYHNTKKGSKTFYHRLSEEDSNLVKEFYEDQMKRMSLSIDGHPNLEFRNQSGTLVAKGYNRIVIGDYGPYIEFNKNQIMLINVKNRWAGKPFRPVKYIWMQTIDDSKTKVYYQRGTVGYADYKVGMFYVDPNDLLTTRDTPDMIC